jgi:hypothetical protein
MSSQQPGISVMFSFTTLVLINECKTQSNAFTTQRFDTPIYIVSSSGVIWSRNVASYKPMGWRHLRTRWIYSCGKCTVISIQSSDYSYLGHVSGQCLCPSALLGGNHPSVFPRNHVFGVTHICHKNISILLTDDAIFATWGHPWCQNVRSWMQLNFAFIY